ncbi:hypothetical protein BJX99DRAFT_255981 [Aspergillus californicus]
MKKAKSIPIYESDRASSEDVAGYDRAHSASVSRCGSQKRHYPPTHAGCRPDPDPDPDPDPVPHMPLTDTAKAQESLAMTRLEALGTLTTCRNVIAALELNRLRKTRTGMCNWIAFWEALYDRAFADLLISRVMSALYKVDALFRAVSFELHQLAQRTGLAIAGASTEDEIIHILEQMEYEVIARVVRRRRHCRHILARLRVNIEAIPVKVSDELFNDMKRGVFALDIFCDYHPGDAKAEQAERMWHQNYIRQRVGLVAMSPYLYRQWRETAVSEPHPLMEYSSNTRWTDYEG